MASVLKTDCLPAVSLMVVQSSKTEGQAELTNNSSFDGISRDELMRMIFMLMSLVGQNMSVIQKSYAQSQLDQEQVAQNEATATTAQTKQYLDNLAAYDAQQDEAQKWGVFGQVMKIVGAVVGIIAGVLLSEVGVGTIILAAVIAFTATPLFDKAVSALGNAIGQAIGNSTWGNIIAQALIVVVLTVATCGAEGLSAGLAGAAKTAGDDAVQEAVSFAPRFNYASVGVLTQTLLSTNLVGELVTQMVEAFPGDENAKKIAETILTVALDIVLMVASCKIASNAASSTGNLVAKLGQYSGDAVQFGIYARRALTTLLGTTQSATALAQGSQGYFQLQEGTIKEGLAPVQARMTFGQSFFQTLTQLASLAQQLYKSVMESDRILFSTNFSSDWSACVAAQNQYQG